MLPQRTVKAYGLDVYATRISYKDKSKTGVIVPVTASGKSQEGNFPSFVLFDEIHHWHQAEALDLYETMSRNALKVRARTVATSNAHCPGQGSVMENLYDRVDDALREKRHTSTLFAIRQAAPDTDLANPDSLLAGLREAYEDAPWAPVEDTAQRFMEAAISVSDFRRFFLSQVVDNGDRWVSPLWVDAVISEMKITDGAMVTLGFDGSKKWDSCALVACEVMTGKVMEVKVWERPADLPKDSDWMMPFTEIDRVIEETFSRFQVVGFLADPMQWEGYCDKWAEKYRKHLRVKASGGHSVRFSMGTNQRLFIQAAEATADAFERGHIEVHGSKLAAHCKNAMREVRKEGIFPAKEHKYSAKKVDAVHAMVLAREGRRKAIEAKIAPRGRVTVRSL
ncbi:hypothetical protein [Streptomyces sp. NBC_00237]|uniref:hypothetical protein n=1 Tax=Streptomyces sp. NBC_00237 TaxID=2975687 RepID=UPI002B1E27B7|nr:hypothetical protein [Streptomyces sp. NBC_00237]